MEKSTFDRNQPQGSMSLLNLRNTLRALFQSDIMPLRPRASLILDDMEYPSDAGAQAEWSGTGVTVGYSTAKQEGNYALELAIDATGDRAVARSLTIDLSAFTSVKVWERCDAASSAIKFYLKDSSGNISYWDITTNGSADTWQQDTLTLSSPDSNNGTDATLSDIVEFGFSGLDASATYIIDTIKAVCGMTVAVETSTPGSYYQNVYVIDQPLAAGIQAAPELTAPSANPRIDILTINSAGTLAWVTGAEASPPSAPWSSLTPEKLPICLVYCKSTMTSVLDYEDKDSDSNQGYIYADVRPLLQIGFANLANLINTDEFKITSGLLMSNDWVSNDLKQTTNSSPQPGWADITATYTGKFMRVSTGAALDTGGSDTHTHAAGSYAGPSHTHSAGTLAAANESAHTHSLVNLGTYQTGFVKKSSDSFPAFDDETGGGSAHGHSISGDTAASGTGAITGVSAAGDNVPAYFNVKLHQKS